MGESGKDRGRVQGLWRYPVKSMLGESLTSALVTALGVQGDRSWGVVDPASGRVLSAKREALLFSCRSRLDGGATTVILPDDRAFSLPDPQLETALSDLLGRRVVIRSAEHEDDYRIEMGANSTTTEGEASEFKAPPGTFFDSAPIHLVTTSSLAALRELSPDVRIDERRFRPNFVVELEGSPTGFVEETWTGKEVAIGGSLKVEVLKPCSRCVMVTHEQDDLPKERAVLQTVARKNDNNLGVLARVVAGGPVSVGDEVVVL